MTGIAGDSLRCRDCVAIPFQPPRGFIAIPKRRSRRTAAPGNWLEDGGLWLGLLGIFARRGRINSTIEHQTSLTKPG